MTKPAKPRIVRIGSDWYCTGAGSYGDGYSPVAAYRMWTARKDWVDWLTHPPQATREPDSFWSHDMSRLSVFEWILILSPLLAIAWFSIRAIL